MVKPGQRARERLALLGELDATWGRDEKLRPDCILKPLDLTAHRRLAGVGDLRGAVERFGLGHGQKDAKLRPELPTQKRLFIERALVERLLFLVKWEHDYPLVVMTI